jgi:hypothetical protein
MSCKLIDKYNNNKVDYVKKKIKNNSDNPKFSIEEININNKKINIIQDGKLISGTKQRVAKLFIKEIIKKNKNIKNLVYSGVYNGFGAIATAYGCHKLNLNCFSFLSKKNQNQTINELKETRQISTLMALNSNIYICNNYVNAKKMKYEISNDDKHSLKDDFYIVPMGLNDEEGIMINLLSKQIKKASKNTILEENKNPRIWLVSGSGGIAMSIKKAFPNAFLYILLTGGVKYKKKIKEWSKKEKNVEIIINENFQNILNYYPSVKNYNDLIFPYINKYSKCGDFIWNVSSDEFI